jgi:hypothetical protein
MRKTFSRENQLDVHDKPPQERGLLSIDCTDYTDDKKTDHPHSRTSQAGPEICVMPEQFTGESSESQGQPSVIRLPP